MRDPFSQPDSTEPRRDPLDALLEQARWPEPDVDSQRRLAEGWDRLSPARSHFRLRRSWAAIAASVILAIGVGRYWRHTGAPPVVRRGNDPISAVTPPVAIAD